MSEEICPGCGKDHVYNTMRCHECRAFVTIPCEAWHYEDRSEARYDDVGKRKVGEPLLNIPRPSFVVLERHDGIIEGIGYYEGNDER
jgi:hypothetical protein